MLSAALDEVEWAAVRIQSEIQIPKSKIRMGDGGVRTRLGRSAVMGGLLLLAFACLGRGADSSDKTESLFNASPALFVEDKAVVDGQFVRYVHRGNGVEVLLTDSGMTYQIARGDGEAIRFARFGVSFPGSRLVTPEGMGESKARFNYYVGRNRADWRIGVPAYEKAVYRNLYPGVDLIVQGLKSHLKYEFRVAPNVNPGIIRGAFRLKLQAEACSGIEGLAARDDGGMNIATTLGTLVDGAPSIFQEKDGIRSRVAGRYLILDKSTYTVEVTGAYDHRRELVIDPDVEWSQLLGGTLSQNTGGITSDSDGAIYVTGWTLSDDFPTNGDWDMTFNGDMDAFVTKFLPDGTMVWSTYFGGSDRDLGLAITAEGASAIYITGQTVSTDLPTNDGWDTTLNDAPDQVGSGDAFAAKFSTGGALVWSTYLGGNGTDVGRGIAAGGAGAVYVTGTTSSDDFPSAGGWDTQLSGDSDAFVTKFSSAGSLIWSTYLGGSHSENGTAAATDGSGNVYVVGDTDSSNLPHINGWDPFYSGHMDGFVMKLDPAGTPLWSTYVGGSGYDSCAAVGVDGSGNVCVTGPTFSSDFPATGAYDTSYNGGGDIYVAKFGATGGLLWSTFVGGRDEDYPMGLATGVSDSIYITGGTLSTNYPATNGWDKTYNGGYFDAVVTKLNASGRLAWSTYLGGTSSDSGTGITTDGHDIYVAGDTSSSDFPNIGGLPAPLTGGFEVFVAKFTDGPRTLHVSSQPVTGLAVTGTSPGTTNYSAILDDASSVLLRTLAMATGEYRFVRWRLNGTAQAPGNSTLAFSINRDSSAVAEYKPYKALKIIGTGIVSELRKARYACRLYCKDGSYYNITPYAKWSTSSIYARFAAPGLLKTYSVPSSKRCRLTAIYAGKSCYLYVTIKNTR